MNWLGEDAGKLLLRVLVGGLLILHGFHKLVSGPGDIAHLLAAHGVPGFLAVGVYLGEVVGPLLMLIGVYTRIGALLVIANMVVAVLVTRGSHLFGLNEYGGLGIELEVFYGVGALCVAMLGAGAYSAGGKTGKFN
ncbi:MAG TPA: DoxX family protein [Gammaproteobacteria bacterium]|jgi:putative oxidoreductase|nr:DoxX family protein [Gammaproteobacteria bacterium]